jgi:hypothetical protein
MKFHLKMTIELKKEFDIEAEHLKDAREIAEKQLLEEVDLNTLEVISIGLDMTDPSILEYNGKMCKMIVDRERAKRKTDSPCVTRCQARCDRNESTENRNGNDFVDDDTEKSKDYI